MMCTWYVTSHVYRAAPVTIIGHFYDNLVQSLNFKPNCNVDETAHNTASAVHAISKSIGTMSSWPNHCHHIWQAQSIIAISEVWGHGAHIDPHWQTAVQLCLACCVAPSRTISGQTGHSQATPAQDHKRSSCNCKSVHGRELLASAYLLFAIDAARHVCHTCTQATCKDMLRGHSTV